jgi:hypothetical protein
VVLGIDEQSNQSAQSSKSNHSVRVWPQKNGQQLPLPPVVGHPFAARHRHLIPEMAGTQTE